MSMFEKRQFLSCNVPGSTHSYPTYRPAGVTSSELVATRIGITSTRFRPMSIPRSGPVPRYSSVSSGRPVASETRARTSSGVSPTPQTPSQRPGKSLSSLLLLRSRSFSSNRTNAINASVIVPPPFPQIPNTS